MATISCSSAETVPKECQRMGAKSAKVSRRLESSRSADSRCEGSGGGMCIRHEVRQRGESSWVKCSGGATAPACEEAAQLTWSGLVSSRTRIKIFSASSCAGAGDASTGGGATPSMPQQSARTLFCLRCSPNSYLFDTKLCTTCTCTTCTCTCEALQLSNTSCLPGTIVGTK